MLTSAECSAGASLTPSPRKPTTSPARRSAWIILFFCAGLTRQNRFALLGAAASATSSRAAISLPLQDAFDGQAELRADMLRDELVVASNDLHGYPQQPKRRDRLGCTCLRRIDECHEACECQILLIADVDMATHPWRTLWSRLQAHAGPPCIAPAACGRACARLRVERPNRLCVTCVVGG